MVTFKRGWDKLYYTQHTLLCNGGQLFIFFEKLTHTQRERERGSIWLLYFCFCSSFNYITFNLFSSFKMELWWWVSSVTFKFYTTLTFDLIFSCFLVFFFNFCLEMREIKIEQKYIFTLIFNIDGLQKANDANLRWAKWHFSNHK